MINFDKYTKPVEV